MTEADTPFQCDPAEASAFRRTTVQVGERHGRGLSSPSLRIAVLVLLAIIAASACFAQEPSIDVGPLQRCVPIGETLSCRAVSLDQLSLADPIDHVRRTVTVPPAADDAQLPLAVTLVGTMSAEVRWNGALIGRNGIIGPDRASETAGRFHTIIPVPRSLVHTGANVVDIRLSAHHRWLPVHRPVQQIGIGYYEGQAIRELRAYWPALLTVGVLLLAMLYFGVLAVAGRGRRDALILAASSACVALQLAIETSRSFLHYAYPWQIARVAAIGVLVAISSALMCAYAARRFQPRRMRLVIGASVGSSALAIMLLPSFDAKAWMCLGAATVLCLFCTVTAARDRQDARLGVVVAVLFAAILLIGRGGALDRGYYLFMAALLAGLVAEQVFGLRQLYSGYETERRRSAALTARLVAAEADGRAIISLRDGSAVYRVPEDEIVRITAADDFCEVTLTNQRPKLVPGPLKALAASLPEGFMRVHKSHIVNLQHVTAINPRPGGGQQLALSDGSSTPIGRSYRSLVRDRWQSPSDTTSLLAPTSQP